MRLGFRDPGIFVGSGDRWEWQQAKRGGAMSSWAAMVTALVAVVGIFITLRSQRKEYAREGQRRHDQELARVVENLGADSLRVRLNAAAALTGFLRPDAANLHADLLTVVIANLKIEREPDVADVLVRGFEVAVREVLKTHNPKDLDLSRAHRLLRLDMKNLDLTGISVDIAFANLTRANLSHAKSPRLRGWCSVLDKANLSYANLREARLNLASIRDAKFHQARLCSSTFKGADLRGAQFHWADLQSCHFEGARCEGAAFLEADISDAWFYAEGGATASLDDTALRSLSRSRNRSWKRAHFSRFHRAAVWAYAGEPSAMKAYGVQLARRNRPSEAEGWFAQAIRRGVAVEAGAMRKLAMKFEEAECIDEAVFWHSMGARGGDPLSVERIIELGAGVAIQSPLDPTYLSRLAREGDG